MAWIRMWLWKSFVIVLYNRAHKTWVRYMLHTGFFLIAKWIHWKLSKVWWKFSDAWKQVLRISASVNLLPVSLHATADDRMFLNEPQTKSFWVRKRLASSATLSIFFIYLSEAVWMPPRILAASVHSIQCNLRSCVPFFDILFSF